MTFFVGDNYKSLLNPLVEPNATFFHLSATSLLGQYELYFKWLLQNNYLHRNN